MAPVFADRGVFFEQKSHLSLSNGERQKPFKQHD